MAASEPGTGRPLWASAAATAARAATRPRREAAATGAPATRRGPAAKRPGGSARGLVVAVGAPLVVGLALLPAPGLAAAAEAGGGGLIKLTPSLLVQVLNFLLLLGLLYRFAYRPLLRVLDNRAALIRQQLAEAQAAREQAQHQLAEFEERLRAAQGEAAQVREQALREAAATRERLTAEAREEAARLREAARTEIEREVRRAREQLRAEVGALAVEIAERLIRRSLRDEDHRRIVSEALARLDGR